MDTDEHRSDAVIDRDDASAPFFYGLESRCFSSDRFYRVYVSDNMIAGAYVAGQIYNEQLAAVQFQALSLVLGPLIRRRLAQLRERETLYDGLDPFAPSMLTHDARNFQILRSDVARTRFRAKRNLRASPNVGIVEFEFYNGKTKRLILVGDQDPASILALMQHFDPAIEVIGKPRPRPTSPLGKRDALRRAAVVFIALGAGLCSLSLTKAGANSDCLPVGFGSMLFGGWFLFKAWRAAKQHSLSTDDAKTDQSI